MRDIKFRGKPTQNNTSYFDDDDWVYGSLTIQKDKYYIVLEVIKNIKRDDYAVYMIEVIPETIGQYTGLKDKNGKEIYERDIVQAVFEDEEEAEIKGIVVYAEAGAYMVIVNNGDEWDLGYLDKIEKIGNKWDNPKLLEKGE